MMPIFSSQKHTIPIDGIDQIITTTVIIYAQTIAFGLAESKVIGLRGALWA